MRTADTRDAADRSMLAPRLDDRGPGPGVFPRSGWPGEKPDAAGSGPADPAAGVPGTGRRPGRFGWYTKGLGGFALFGYNIGDTEQVAGADRGPAHRPGRRGHRDDEEGGDVTRLCYAQGSPYPGNAALGVVDDVDLTRGIYHAIGAELAASGITLDMAPAVDVNSADDNPTIGTRSFGADATRVAAHASGGGRRSADGRRGRVRQALSRARGDGDWTPTTTCPSWTPRWSCSGRGNCRRSMAAIAAGVRAVMTAHIRVPVLTGDLPATFSPEALIGLLRKELGFGGAVVSDALEMQGASGVIGIPEAAVRALVAGNDLLCFGGELPKYPAAEEVIEATASAIVDAVREGRLTAERLEEAAARNARLSGPVGWTGPTAWIRASASWRRGARCGSRAPCHRRWSTASSCSSNHRRRSRWGRCRGDSRPTSTGSRRSAWPMPSTAGSSGRGRGHRRSRPPDARSSSSAGTPTATRGPARSSNCLSAHHPAVVLVEMGWPAAWRPAGAQAYVATYGAARANARAAAELLRYAGGAKILVIIDGLPCISRRSGP